MSTQPADARALLAARMTEREFQAQVMAMLRLLGWRAYHTLDSRGSARGYPDIVALRGRRCLALELKTERGRVTQDQQDWLEAFAAAGAESGVWRPSQIEELTEVLR